MLAFARLRVPGGAGRTRSRGYPGSVTDAVDPEALIERLRLIEEQSLEDRAEGYEGIIRELHTELESADER